MATPSPAEPISKRERELYKYFQPTLFQREHVSETPKSPDPTLTAFTQLVTLKLGARRCNINLLDRRDQYNIAEGTKTLHLGSNISDDPKDSLIFGCTPAASTDSICQYTIRATSAPDGRPGFFEVLDLSNDRRFSSYSFVVGPPQVKYYYGAPLKTRNGVAIGALCVLDDQVRKPMSLEQRNFLAVMAANVMTHLGLLREKTQRRRATNMNKCLTQFVDIDVECGESVHGVDNHPQRRRRRGSSSRPSNGTDSPVSFPSGDASQAHIPDLPSPSTTTTTSRSPSPYEFHDDSFYKDSRGMDIPRVSVSNHSDIFKQAAGLLRKSLDVEDGGGVVFLDTVIATNQTSKGSTSKSAGEIYNGLSHRGLAGNVNMQVEDNHYGRESRDTRVGIAEVLASSIASPTSPGSHKTAGIFTPLPLETMVVLVGRYPRGNLWIMDSDGRIHSGTDEDDSSNETERCENDITYARLQAEAELLLQHFPGACQIIFLPVWDARTSRWCAAFAYSTSLYRIFNRKLDFLYCTAFANCVTMELARLATLAADQQKGDFIGSISHELRSPLHGILASCEFLQDQNDELSDFQRSLVDTVDACGRTLLDTINMVLDYSKINTFEREWRKTKKPRKGTLPSNPVVAHGIIPAAVSGQPLLNIYGNVDLAAITEEVVEGVTTGQAFFLASSTVDLTDMGPKARGRTADRGTQGASPLLSSNVISLVHPEDDEKTVEVILDIAPAEWTFVTQPGAFRRIVMNITGNALKYTTRGYIKIKLEIDSDLALEHTTSNASYRDVSSDMVILTITDTGKGISPEYLRDKVFTPFSQEDTLAPGTGLGLSLVRSIVTMLDGEINITSTVNKGTEVRVRIPMLRQSGNSSASTPSTVHSGISSLDRLKDDSVSVLRKRASDCRIASFHRHGRTLRDNEFGIAQTVQDILTQYVTEWFGLSMATVSSRPMDANVVIVDEADLSAFVERIPGGLASKQRPSLIVLCSNSSRHGRLSAYVQSGVQFVSKPFGPYKLAKAIRLSIERLESSFKPSLSTLVEPRSGEGESGHLTPILEKLILSTGTDILSVIQMKGIVGNDESSNAHMVLESNSDHDISSVSTVGTCHYQEFPFPDTSSTIVEDLTTPTEAPRPSLNARRTISPNERELNAIEASRSRGGTSYMSVAGSIIHGDSPISVPNNPLTSLNARTTSNKFTTPLSSAASMRRQPRLLLVDDNSINLKLLQTFMKKRKYTNVASASDGQQAVDSFNAALNASNSPAPPDIIFMDISMPIMNGFEATRHIRKLESQYSQRLESEHMRKIQNGEEQAAEAELRIKMQTPIPTLIIALTGLASGKDQSEAFRSGVDLYITKPVSFKEVGRLLDNWERKAGSMVNDHTPHGAVVAKLQVV